MENLSGLLLPLLFLVALYLLMIRPQQKRQKEHQQLIASIGIGDDVITVGGVHGRVAALTDESMDLEVTDDIVIRFQRSSLARVVRDDIVLDEEVE